MFSHFKIFHCLDSQCPTPSGRMSRKERFNMTNATDNQLELGFNGIRPQANVAGRKGRIARASWCFAQMRDIVERAMDWETAGEPRPEQIWIPGASREVE